MTTVVNGILSIVMTVKRIIGRGDRAVYGPLRGSGVGAVLEVLTCPTPDRVPEGQGRPASPGTPYGHR